MSGTEIKFDETVDTAGAACPGPLMELVGVIERAESGAVVRPLSDNEQSASDVPKRAEQAGNTVLGSIEQDDSYECSVEKP
ncbi:TusA-related sulfurtransferase [Halogranum amylolyticum]|uniref:TusA-related sulfurtransferase n=1 Tax=Halogranum amylolyticum TaxID=660520 RepID=A0A1H8U4H0_9EURY|nr:sulfurtransferase TusA family protein [Halogranum amylolyticum]SEO98071.1 TusA-related sulfurtransferase [Halogranum amylolyticum]